MIVAEQLRQHEAWREARSRVDGAPFIARPRPVVKTIDVRPKPKEPPLPMVPVQPSSRDWLIVTAAGKHEPPTYLRIMHEVSAKHELTIHELRSNRRDRLLVAARNEAMWRMKRETSLSLPAIGHKMGGRDHTTVLHGIRRHEARIAAGEA